MFQCSACGICCRNLDKSELYKGLDRGDGTCIYLDENLCSIYKDRPLICRVDESYQQFFSSQYSLEEYYQLNYDACKALQNKQR